MKEVKIKTKKSIDSSSVIFIFGLVVFAILLFTLKNFWICSIGAVALIYWRLHSGKLKVHAGDVYFAFGKPGAGKTMFQAAVAYWNKKGKHPAYIYVNDELSHLKTADAVISREDIGKYRFGSSSRTGIVLYDEVSLDGFDNRNFKTNFKGSVGEDILKGFKKCRHRYTGYVLTNQGYDEVDLKIRQNLVKACYWIKNKGSYSVAIRLDKDFKIDEITGQPMDCYMRPSWLDRLLNPSTYIYFSHKKFGSMYSTVNDNSPFYWDEIEKQSKNNELSFEMIDQLLKDSQEKK